ncbi:MAG: hypothetical protein KDA79_15860 [Planctomycetaceae bacterium]|nr:hypothetical protein [Planctomycetaceae bacterium]
MNLEVGAGLSLDRSRIPETLHQLVPLIERWGFEIQEQQDQFVREMQAGLPSEVAEFNRRIDEATHAIISWSRTVPEVQLHKFEMDEESWNHPYWSFLAALKIRELTEPEDSPAAQAARQSMTAEARSIRFSRAAEQATILFRYKDYQQFIELLTPFDDLLTDTQRRKLDFARRRRNLPGRK